MRTTAAAAPIVFVEADRGDLVAMDLIRWAGRELGSLATGVVRQLGLEEAAFDLVLIGSLFKGGRGWPTRWTRPFARSPPALASSS